MLGLLVWVVILFQFWLAPLFLAAPSTAIWDLDSDAAKFSKFIELLKETEMGFKLDSSRDLTVFLPTNQAVSTVGFDDLQKKLAYDQRIRILKAHVLPMVVKIHDLSDGVHTYQTLEGSNLTISVLRRELTRNQARRGRPAPARAFVTLDGSKESYELVDGLKVAEVSSGVAYPISGLMVPQDLVDLLKATTTEDDSTAVYQVPPHVVETGRAHWRTQEDGEAQRKAEGEFEQLDQAEPVGVASKYSSIGVFLSGVGTPVRGTSKRVEGLVGFKPIELMEK